MNSPPRHVVALRPAARLLAASVGAALLLWCALAPTPPLSPPLAEPGRATVAGYHTRIAPVERLSSALRRGVTESEPAALVALVHASLAHGPSPRARAADNWLAWAIGSAWSDARLVQGAERLAALGVGLCSDAVVVLSALAEDAGYECAMVDLEGHVVATLRRGGLVWTADPDFGLVFEGEPAGLARLADEGALAEALAARGHDARKIDAYERIARTAESAEVIAHGVISPRLAALESVLCALAWLLPAALFAWGLGGLRRGTV